MSLKTNEEILSGLTLVPAAPTIANYARIFTDPAWYTGYINSLIYVGDQRRPEPGRGPARGLRVLALQASSATSTCSSGC